MRERASRVHFDDSELEHSTSFEAALSFSHADKRNVSRALSDASGSPARAHKRVDIIIIIRRKPYHIVIHILTLYASGRFFIPQLSACQRDFTHRKRTHLGYWKSKMDPKLIEMGRVENG